MYRPPHFRVDDDVALEMVDAVAFGHLVVVGTEGLDATPLPFLLDRRAEGCSIRCHVARANPIWRSAPCDSLLIVPSAGAYVSPSWYPSKAEHGAVVPTWNYEVVHLHGRLVAHHDVAWLGDLVRRLTDRHERDLPVPWSVDDAPPEFVDRQLRAIVGLEVEVVRVEGKRKLSQNRDEADRDGVVTGLGDRDDPAADAVARAMRRPLA